LALNKLSLYCSCEKVVKPKDWTLVLLGSTACLNQGAKSKTPGTRQHTETKAHEKKGTNDVMDEAMHTDGSWVTGDENGGKEPPLANISGGGQQEGTF